MFFCSSTMVLKRQQSAISYGCCGLMFRKKKKINAGYLLARGISSVPGQEINTDSNTFNLSWFVTHHSIHPRLHLHWHRQQWGHFCFISKCPPLIASLNPVEQIKKFAAFCLLAFHFVSSAADCSDRSSPRDLVVDKEALQSERMCLRSAALHFWTQSKYDFHRMLFFSPLYIRRLLIFPLFPLLVSTISCGKHPTYFQQNPKCSPASCQFTENICFCCCKQDSKCCMLKNQKNEHRC